MGKTAITIISVVVVLLLIAGVGAGIYFYTQKGASTTKTEATSDDGFATMTITYADKNGDPIISGTQQSIIGGTFIQAYYFFFTLKASNVGGNVPLTNVKVASENSNLVNAFNNNGNPPTIASLAIGASGITLGTSANSCTDEAQCDIKEDCVGTTEKTCKLPLLQYEALPQPTEFTVTLSGDYQDAVGTAQQIISGPVTISSTILPETCTGGTPINTCVLPLNTLNTLQFCKFVSGTAPLLVTDCRGPDGVLGGGNDCGCAVNYACQSNGACAVQTCTDGTEINAFSTATGTYGGLTMVGGYATNKAYTRVYCSSGLVLQESCNLAKTQIGAGNVNANGVCNAPNKANLPAINCNPTTGEPSQCVYTTAIASLSGTIIGTS